MTESSWQWGPEIVGDAVYDVNGRRMGRVAGIHEGTDALDVELTDAMARKLRANGRFLRVPMHEIVDADDHDVTLDEEAELLAHPEKRVAPEI